MKFIERREGSYKELIDAVKGLRVHFGESQQAFATRFGLSIRSIANYEKDRKPEGRVLAIFARAASDAGRGDLVSEFMIALGVDLGLSDIKGGVFDSIASDGRGHMLIQFSGFEARGYARAFFDTFMGYQSGDAQAEARAKKLLENFTTEATRTWRNR